MPINDSIYISVLSSALALLIDSSRKLSKIISPQIFIHPIQRFPHMTYEHILYYSSMFSLIVKPIGKKPDPA